MATWIDRSLASLGSVASALFYLCLIAAVAFILLIAGLAEGRPSESKTAPRRHRRP